MGYKGSQYKLVCGALLVYSFSTINKNIVVYLLGLLLTCHQYDMTV
jgi:hypothetical protein